MSGVLGSHFTDIKQTLYFKVIQCDHIIISRVVFVKSDDTGVGGYLSSVLKSYQNDECNIYYLYGLDMGYCLPYQPKHNQFLLL